MPPVIRREPSGSRPQTVLVVDDDPMLLRATARTLQLAGFEVVSADGPFGVSTLVERYEPAAVVLDVCMPGLDGPRLAELLGDLPIVFYSGLETVELVEIAERIPGAHWASKADGPAALAKLLRAVIPPGRRSTVRPRARHPEPTTYSLAGPKVPKE